MDIHLQCHHLLILYLPPLLLALYAITQHLLHKLLNLPPTPFPILPLLGHIHFFISNNTPLHRTLSQLSRRHGPLLFLRIGSRSVLLVSSPSAARECLITNDVVFANRPKLLNGKHFGYDFTSLAWASYGDHWRNLRRISTIDFLSFHKINSLSSIRADEARALTRKLLRVMKEGDAIVDMRKVLFEHTYDVVMGMITGESGTERAEEAAEFMEIVAEMSAVTVEANVVDFVPFVGWLGFGGVVERKMRWVQGKRERFMANVMGRYRWRREEAGGNREERSLITTLLELQREVPEYYTDQTIRNLLLVLLQGATHSTSNTLEWAFSLLLQNPHTLKTARSHIDNLVAQHRLITDSDVSKIPYLHHIINETLRIHPPAPLLTPHLSSEECTVGGSRIPRGTMLLVNAWDIQNDPRIWEDPEKFIPQRFERVGEGMSNIDDLKFLPFGWGRRACPGEKLAMAMVGLALGTLIQCFEWDKVGEIDMREGRGVITPRAQPLRARCSPRPFIVNLVSLS